MVACTAVAKASPNGMFTAAQYRDATGVGRGLAIQILEFLDGLAITQRVGDARKMRKDPAGILGAAAPFKPSPSAAPAKDARSASQQTNRPGAGTTGRTGR